jgi:hypothetical protein
MQPFTLMTFTELLFGTLIVAVCASTTAEFEHSIVDVQLIRRVMAIVPVPSAVTALKHLFGRNIFMLVFMIRTLCVCISSPPVLRQTTQRGNFRCIIGEFLKQLAK